MMQNSRVTPARPISSGRRHLFGSLVAVGFALFSLPPPPPVINPSTRCPCSCPWAALLLLLLLLLQSFGWSTAQAAAPSIKLKRCWFCTTPVCCGSAHATWSMGILKLRLRFIFLSSAELSCELPCFTALLGTSRWRISFAAMRSRSIADSEKACFDNSSCSCCSCRRPAGPATSIGGAGDPPSLPPPPVPSSHLQEEIQCSDQKSSEICWSEA